MKYAEYILSIFSIMINLSVLIKAYGKVSNMNIRLRNIKNIFLILIYSLIFYLVNINFPQNYRWFIVGVIMFIFYEIFYNEKIFITLIKTIIIYLIMMLLEFILSIIIIQFPHDLDIIKTCWTYVLSFCLYLLFSIKFITNALHTLFNYIDNNKKNFYLFFVAFTFISFNILLYYNAETLSIKGFFVSFTLITFFLLLCLILIYQYFKNKHIEDEQHALLKLMNEYEGILDRDRINRHEMINNLLVLKSYPNKATKGYDKILDNIIEDYQSKKSKNYANLYKLPSGIKGIVYYKITNITDNNIEFNTVISKESTKNIERLESKLYFNVCKIIGILLDNAIEACTLADKKEILLDIYTNENINCIYIENTYKGSIDINQINKKGYSSKGKGRGLGLHIVNKIIKENKNLEIEQYINNDKFVTILKIKNPE